MSTVEDVRPVPVAPTPVSLGGVRGGPDSARTLRKDRWWLSPVITVGILTSFVVYSTWAAFQNRNYFVGAAAHRDLISPFYSPCLAGSCVPGSHPGVTLVQWTISPAILILIVPLGFRLTCYYYRHAYYRGFWQSPPACGVADAHAKYTGESRFPLILQNAHRYFFYLGLVLNVILTIDAVVAYREPGEGIGVSIGALVLTVNAVLLWSYSLSCHACRHLCGGNVNRFSAHKLRARIWKTLTPLNSRHMQIAWASLVFVALTDLYVRLVAAGVFSDPKLF